MRKFWDFYDNGQYRVGCNGGTIYIYDKANKELSKFKDIPYVCSGALHPNANLFVAKSTAGFWLCTIEHLVLMKKLSLPSSVASSFEKSLPQIILDNR